MGLFSVAHGVANGDSTRRLANTAERVELKGVYFHWKVMLLP